MQYYYNEDNIYVGHSDDGLNHQCVIETDIAPPLPINANIDYQFNGTGWTEVVSKKIILAKEEKIKEITEFWGSQSGKARIIKLRNGHIQYLLANQDAIDNLKSMQRQILQEDKHYSYRIRDNNGRIIFNDKGEPIIIPITFQTFDTMISIIEARRGYCKNSLDYHIGKVDKLKTIDEVINYRYRDTNDLGEAYIPAQEIVIDEQGNIVLSKTKKKD